MKIQLPHTATQAQAQASGFTLIELVVVIIIITALLVFALPRFSDLTDTAELTQAEGIASAFQSGVKLVKLTFDTNGFTTRTQDLNNYGNGTIDTNNIGYPIGTDKGNGNENIGRGNAGCALLWRGLLSNPPTVSHNTNTELYRSYRHTGNRMCSYVYRGGGDTAVRGAAQLLIEYDSRDGAVRVCGQRSDIPNC